MPSAQDNIDNLVGGSSAIQTLQQRVAAALSQSQAAQDAVTALSNTQAPAPAAPAQTGETCAVTIIQAGKTGDDTFEVPVGSSVESALAQCGRSSAGCVIKKQSNGGTFVNVANPSSSYFSAGSNTIMLAPKVAGGK
jgi:hypothetical protein